MTTFSISKFSSEDFLSCSCSLPVPLPEGKDPVSLTLYTVLVNLSSVSNSSLSLGSSLPPVSIALPSESIYETL